MTANNKKLFSIFLIVFIDLLGFSIILPFLPFYATAFGANAVTTEALVAIYALMQFISAPLLGRLSDRQGRRIVLLLSIAGNIVAYVILGFANSLLIMFVARALAGLFSGNISVAQAYITDITDEKNRAKGLGLIGAAFGLGFYFRSRHGRLSQPIRIYGSRAGFGRFGADQPCACFPVAP